MNRLRLPESLVNIIRRDLERPHEFAYERVGFLFCRMINTPLGPLALGSEYIPVNDEHYSEDPLVGAKIGSEAIRKAMQRVLSMGEGCFHVHLHAHRGRPGLSGTDIREVSRLLPSLQAVGRELIHGALLLSEDAMAAVQLDAGDLKSVQIELIGFPLRRF